MTCHRPCAEIFETTSSAGSSEAGSCSIKFERLFILTRLAGTHFVGNDTMNAHFEVFQDGCQRIEVIHFDGCQGLRELGKGSIDQWSTAILAKQRGSALMLVDPCQDKRRVLLVDASPGIIAARDNGATKQLQAKAIIRNALLEKFVGFFRAATRKFVDRKRLHL